MNKIAFFFMVCPAILLLSSCKNTLDTYPTSSFDEETVWSTKETINTFIIATYRDVLHGSGMYANSGVNINWECRTPNSVQCDQVTVGIDNFTTELGISASSDFGPNRFSILRRCNLIIEKVNESDLFTESEKKVLSAPGYLLRGMIFFDQTRKMGRFVPVCEVFDSSDSLACRIPMTTSVEDSYKYVISDLETAAGNLPATESTGLPTKWAAKVILSRACLQAYAYTNDSQYLDKAYNAAKDVVENSGISLSSSTGMFDGTDSYNKEILWGYYFLAKDLKMSGLEEILRTIPLSRDTDQKACNSEHIHVMRNGLTFGGWCRYFPTQDLIDQYLVVDEATGEALPWYETTQYKSNVEHLDPLSVTTPGQIDQLTKTNGDVRRMPSPQDLTGFNNAYPTLVRFDRLKEGSTRNISELMYSGRDKRFYTNISYDGCMWLGEYCDINWGGNLFQGVRDREDGGWYTTATGYYWRKNNQTGTVPRAHTSVDTDYSYHLARLGEAYMNLAEAALLKGLTAEALKAINATRTVHGGLPESKATTQDEIWEDYIRERRCEMCNEQGDNYWSYLRWGKYGGFANHGRQPGDIIYDLDRPVYKIEINHDRSVILVGQVTLMGASQRSFSTRRYLLPIQQAFLDMREAYGLDHQQTQGW